MSDLSVSAEHNVNPESHTMAFLRAVPGRSVARSLALAPLKGTITALCALLLSTQVHGQDAAPSYLPFAFPRTMAFGSLSHQLSLAQAELPENYIETDVVFRAPHLDYQLRFGLGGHFLAEGSVNSNVVTWHFSLGPKYVIELERLHLAAGYDVAYWFGRLDHSGFDTRLDGWIHYPNLAVGHRFNGFTLTAEGRLIVITGQHYRVGELEVDKAYDRVPGLSFTLFLEQPLWKENVITIGARMYWTKFYYPSWAAFTTFDHHYWIPELIFGLVL